MINYLYILYISSLTIKELDFNINKVYSFDIPTDGPLEYSSLMSKMGSQIKESCYIVKDKYGDTVLVYSIYKKGSKFYTKSTILKPVDDHEVKPLKCGMDCVIRIDERNNFYYSIPNLLLLVEKIDGLTLFVKSIGIDEINLYLKTLKTFHMKNISLGYTEFFDTVSKIILDIKNRGSLYKSLDESILLYFEKDYDLVRRFFKKVLELKDRRSEYEDLNKIIEDFISRNIYGSDNDNLINDTINDSYTKKCIVKRLLLFDIMNILRLAWNPDGKCRIACLADIQGCVRGSFGIYITGKIDDDLGISHSVSVIGDGSIYLDIEGVSVVEGEIRIFILTSEISKYKLKTVKVFLSGVDNMYESREIKMEELINN